MVSLMLFIFAAPPFELDELPSPSFVAQSVGVHRSIAEYKSLLSHSKTVLSKLARYSTNQRSALICSWWRKNSKFHRELQVKHNHRHDGIFCDIESSRGMSQVDMNKLDLIFVINGQKPLFHTEGWLRKVYSVTQDFPKPFVIPDYPEVPWVLGGSKGGVLEPSDSSFEPFFMSESKATSKWIESKMIGKPPAAMTVGRMYRKIDRMSVN